MELLRARLENLGYVVQIFNNKQEATLYLNQKLDGTTIGLGGSVTLAQMNIYENLKTHNTVFWHMHLTDKSIIPQTRRDSSRADVYITSVNAISRNGEIVNIDNTGNRVAAATFGCNKVYFVIGKNKICDSLDDAIFRARNIAAPLNAKRLGVKTPCAKDGTACYDCDSPERICRNLSIFWKKPTGCSYEILLINEDLGF